MLQTESGHLIRGQVALCGIVVAGTRGLGTASKGVHSDLRATPEVLHTRRSQTALFMSQPLSQFLLVGVPGQARRDVWYSGPVVAHTHTTTAVHSRKAQHSVKTQIMAPTHAGPYGDTPLHCNMAGFCGELDERLYALNSTLAGVYQDVQDKLSDQQHSATLRKSRSSGARVHMNGSLARQVQLLTAAWTTYCDET